MLPNTLTSTDLTARMVDLPLTVGHAHAATCDPAPAARAFTVILSGPNHLIGERDQVDLFFAPAKRGKKGAELPPWYAEWRDFLPHWQLEILETPRQVAAFFTAARHDPHTPHPPDGRRGAPPPRHGLCCPRCGHRVLNNAFEGVGSITTSRLATIK